MATSETPSYWSIDPDTFGMWVAVLGTAAAGKLMAACAAYFFDGAEPDAYKLTKQARAMFDGERAKLDRRRASALNGARRGRKPASASVDNSVNNSETSGKVREKPLKTSRKTAKKSPKNSTPTHASTCEINKSRLDLIINRSRNINPQTPAPAGEGAGSGGGAGAVSVADFWAMAESLGYDTPSAYGGMLRAV